jgi:hypothetical protein
MILNDKTYKVKNLRTYLTSNLKKNSKFETIIVILIWKWKRKI